MHPRYLNQRDEAAQKTIEEKAQALGSALGLSPDVLVPLTATDRDPAVQTMLRREGVASLLSTIADNLDLSKGIDSDDETSLMPPGTALSGSDGSITVTGSGSRWSAPEDVVRYVEFGQGEDGGTLARALLVGDWGQAAEDDLAQEPGLFLTRDQFDKVVGGPLKELADLKAQLKAPAVAALALGEEERPVPHMGSEQLLERLKAINGVGDALAAKILAALKPQAI